MDAVNLVVTVTNANGLANKRAFAAHEELVGRFAGMRNADEWCALCTLQQERSIRHDVQRSTGEQSHLIWSQQVIDAGDDVRQYGWTGSF